MKFELGRQVVTEGVLASLQFDEITGLIRRHAAGDWGDVSRDDAQENETSLAQGHRLMSVYHVRETKVYVITERDRSATTVLLPEEY